MLSRKSLARACSGPGAVVPAATDLDRGDVAVLRADPLFQERAPEQLGDLLQQAVVRRVARGTTLFAQDEPTSRFHVVLAGWVRLSRIGADGTETTFGLFSRGDSLVEVLLQTPGRYAMTGQAVEASRLVSLPATALLERLFTDDQLCRNAVRIVSRRLRTTQQQLEQVSRRSTVQRLAAFLLRLSRCEQGPCVVALPLGKTFIAARLHMQPESLSRAFARLREHGVEVSGGQVVIGDAARLRTLTGAEPTAARPYAARSPACLAVAPSAPSW
jgi:CRP-like cAMP-binding protein